MLFDQDELEAWLKQGRIGGSDEEPVTVSAKQEQETDAGNQNGIIDIQAGRVYHRSARYR